MGLLGPGGDKKHFTGTGRTRRPQKLLRRCRGEATGQAVTRRGARATSVATEKSTKQSLTCNDELFVLLIEIKSYEAELLAEVQGRSITEE